MRFLPNRISVSIVERTPVAFAVVDSQLELVDADGVLLTMPAAMMARYHFPVIHGIEEKDPAASRKARMAVYQRFVSELDKGGQRLTAQISEIDLSDPEDLRATMPEQGTDILAHFGDDHFLDRWQTYKAHIEEWRERYPKLIGVDLRYNGEIPLEMAPEEQGIGNREEGIEGKGPGTREQGSGKAKAAASAKNGKTIAHAAPKKKAKG